MVNARAVESFARRVEERFGDIHLWINNAGVLEPIAPLRDVPSEDFQTHLEINVRGVFHGSQAYLRHLRTRDATGVLINISSGAAHWGYAGWSAYCASKAAVERLTECIQIEEGARGLRAYAVSPGVIDTHMQELIRSCTPDQFPEVQRFREMKRAGSFNTPEFVARELLAIAFDPEREPSEFSIRLPSEKDS